MNPFDFSWMVGRHAQILFSEPAWFVVFEDSLGITADCPWRLIHDGGIVVSSDDHKQRFGLPVPIDAAKLASSSLAGLEVQRVELREGTADLFISFQQDWKLEIIPFSSGYESWQVTIPSGKTVIAQGRGRLALV